MTKEQLFTLVQNDKFLTEMYREIQRATRMEYNKAIYDIFTPWYIKIWNRLLGRKPYLDYNYRRRL